jgi:superfamily I DNA/RNA helicase
VIPSGQTIRTLLQKPRSPDWSSYLEQTGANVGIRYSTIHNAKGGEYAGVCVVVSPDDARSFTQQLFEAWANRSDHEPKRVIYVGVTRAMRLAALAIPAAFLTRCTAILQSANVLHAVYGSV